MSPVKQPGERPYVPPHMEAAMRSFDDALSSFRTRMARVEQLEMPESERVGPEDLARAAARPDAPPQLKAVATAVAEGRCTWDDVLKGRTSLAPEIAELFAASGLGIEARLREAEHEEAAGRAEADEAAAVAAAEAERDRMRPWLDGR